MSSSDLSAESSVPRTPATRARAEVADPSTAPDRLAAIVALHPGLQTAVAVHPNVYRELLEWIAAHGYGHARQVAQSRLTTTPPRPTATPAAVSDDRTIPAAGGLLDAAGLPILNGYLAGYGTRACAFLIDAALMVLALLLLRAINGFFEMVHLGGIGGLINFVGSLAVLAYLPVFDGVFGQTIGKRLLHLQVVDPSSGLPIGFGRALLRTFVLWSGVWTVFIGCFSPLFDAAGRLRGWHDQAANDLVILGSSPAWTDRLESLKPMASATRIPLGAPSIQYGSGAPALPKTNTMAILAIVAVFLPTGPLSVIFGHIALVQIRRTGEEGRVMAIVGLVFGYLWIGAMLLLIGSFAMLAASLATYSTMH